MREEYKTVGRVSRDLAASIFQYPQCHSNQQATTNFCTRRLRWLHITPATKFWCKWGAAAMHTSAPTQWRSKYLRFSAWCHNRFSPTTLSFFSWLHPELKRNIFHTTTLDYDTQCQGKLARHVWEKGHLVEKLSRHTYCTDCLTWTTKVVDTSCHLDIIFNNLQWEIKYVAANGRKEYQFLILRLSSWFSVQ